MTGERELDAAWLRRALRQVPDVPAVTPADEAALLAALREADPLGARGGDVRDALRALVGGWPGRLAVAVAACAFVAVGFLGGQLAMRDAAPGALAIPPGPIYEPDDSAGHLPAVAPVKPASAAKFKEAMAAYGAPDFAGRAEPALAEAVAADRMNDQAQFWLGVARLLLGRPKDAVAPLEAAVAIAPRNAQYRQYLLFAYIAGGMNDKAARLDAELMRAR